MREQSHGDEVKKVSKIHVQKNENNGEACRACCGDRMTRASPYSTPHGPCVQLLKYTKLEVEMK